MIKEELPKINSTYLINTMYFILVTSGATSTAFANKKIHPTMAPITVTQENCEKRTEGKLERYMTLCSTKTGLACNCNDGSRIKNAAKCQTASLWCKEYAEKKLSS